MDQVDREIAKALELAHAQRQTQVNHYLERESYSPGSLVWVLKPADISTQSKVEARWKGPFQVLSKDGQHSYTVKDKRGNTLMVHVDQLKPYLSLGEPGELAGLEA